jgi:hypothetical protein
MNVAYYSVKLFHTIAKVEDIGDLTLITQSENSKLLITLKSELKNTYCKEIIHVEKKTYRPIQYFCNVIQAKTKVQLHANYNRNNVKVEVASQSGIQKHILKIAKKDTYDNASIFNIIQAISTGLKSINDFYIINLKSFSIIKVNIKFEEDEEIKINNHNYLCRVVKLSFDNKSPNLSQRFFIQKEYPYILVKNISGNQTIELNRFIGG